MAESEAEVLHTPRSSWAFGAVGLAFGLGAALRPAAFTWPIILLCYLCFGAMIYLCRKEFAALYGAFMRKTEWTRLPNDFYFVVAAATAVFGVATYLLVTDAAAAPATPVTVKPSPPVATTPGAGAVSVGRDVHGNICTSGATCIFPPAPRAAKPKLERHSAARVPAWRSPACLQAREVQLEADASPEIRPLLARKFIVSQLYDEYLDRVAPARPDMNDPDAIAYYNERLAQKKMDWRVTPENQAELFSGTFLNVQVHDAGGTGILVSGGGGNTFDRTTIDHTQNPVALLDTQGNHFTDTNINRPEKRSTPPDAEPKECGY